MKQQVKKLTRKQLESRIEKLSQCNIWDVYTRPATELLWDELTQNARFIVYCDIDKMHTLNEKYTHNGVDNRIKKVLTKIRKTDSVIISRWLNGDELIFILNSGIPEEFINRLMTLFNKSGISCTFSYTNKIKDNPLRTINPLDLKVQKSKNKNMRGIIVK